MNKKQREELLEHYRSDWEKENITREEYYKKEFKTDKNLWLSVMGMLDDGFGDILRSNEEWELQYYFLSRDLVKLFRDTEPKGEVFYSWCVARILESTTYVFTKFNSRNKSYLLTDYSEEKMKNLKDIKHDKYFIFYDQHFFRKVIGEDVFD